ncbi:MAG TPA: cation:proton antiporter [Pirellulales bacterium]|jgi:Kef-type K+ transport system membrane component KefB|nr:cation:proton antiporter [Pirellulales bacterium]
MTESQLLASSDADAVLQALRHLNLESVLLPVLYQLAIIVLVARFFFVLFRKLRQPGVVGEIVAGLVLGPSVLGYLWPQAEAAIFHPQVAGVDPQLIDVVLRWVFMMLAQLGLVFLLFLIGLEFDFSHLRRHSRAAIAISATGVALPFVLGLALAPLLLPNIEPHPDGGPVSPLGFALFLGTALSITAIPVLGRMMLELGINRSQLGAVTISAAAVDDATGWILLSTVAAIVAGNFAVGGVMLRIGLTAAFAIGMVFLARPLLLKWATAAMRRGEGDLGLNDLAVLLAIVLVASIATNLIGIFAVFGAFITGAVLSSHHEFREAITRRLRDFMTVFFLPIFFTYTGLRTEVGSLHSIGMWLLCATVVAAAIAGKLLGCGIAARVSGFALRESACIGIMMNTRGLVELIVINLGYEMRVIPKSVFCMLVLMALVTTIMTTPILLRLMRGTELEPYILQSGFLAKSVAAPEERAPHTPSPSGRGPG